MVWDEARGRRQGGGGGGDYNSDENEHADIWWPKNNRVAVRLPFSYNSDSSIVKPIS